MSGVGSQSPHPSKEEEIDVELDLLLDEVLYGNSFHKIVDGKKVRIDPRDVYIQPRWWVRLWYWIKRQFKRGDEWVGCYHD